MTGKANFQAFHFLELARTSSNSFLRSGKILGTGVVWEYSNDLVHEMKLEYVCAGAEKTTPKRKSRISRFRPLRGHEPDRCERK
jgi:hypothetical protein